MAHIYGGEGAKAGDVTAGRVGKTGNAGMGDDKAACGDSAVVCRKGLKRSFHGTAHKHILLAAEELGELGEQGFLRAVEHAQRDRHVFGVGGIERLRAAVVRQARRLFVECVRRAYPNVNAAGNNHDLRRFDGGLRCLGIGAHQAARAQEHAAEITRDHAGHVREAGVLNSFQRGKACSFLRFAVVGIADAPHSAGSAFAQHVGVHVVTRHTIRGADLLEEAERGVLGFHVGEACDEAALFLYDFGLRAAFYGGVRIHGAHYSRAGRDNGAWRAGRAGHSVWRDAVLVVRLLPLRAVALVRGTIALVIV